MAFPSVIINFTIAVEVTQFTILVWFATQRTLHIIEEVVEPKTKIKRAEYETVELNMVFKRGKKVQFIYYYYLA